MIARFSMRPALAALIALVLISIAPSTFAQASAQNPSPAALLLAKQIVQIKGVKSMFDPLLRGVVEKTKDVFMQTNFMWAKDLNEVAVIVTNDCEPRVAELVDATARIYATHFTEAELKDILAFYQSPLGQKMIVEEPKAVDESMANAGQWADNISQEVMAKMRAEMKKRGHDL